MLGCTFHLVNELLIDLKSVPILKRDERSYTNSFTAYTLSINIKMPKTTIKSYNERSHFNKICTKSS